MVSVQIIAGPMKGGTIHLDVEKHPRFTLRQLNAVNTSARAMQAETGDMEMIVDMIGPHFVAFPKEMQLAQAVAHLLNDQVHMHGVRR